MASGRNVAPVTSRREPARAIGVPAGVARLTVKVNADGFALLTDDGTQDAYLDVNGDGKVVATDDAPAAMLRATKFSDNRGRVAG